MENNYKLCDLLKIPFNKSKVHFNIIGFLKFIDGIIPNLHLLITAQFINTAIKIANNEINYKSIYLPILLITLTIAYRWLSVQISKFSVIKLTNNLREYLNVNIINKISLLKYENIEDKDVENLISRIKKDPEIIFRDGFLNILSILSLFIQVIGITFIIAEKIWWISLIISLMMIPVAYMSIKNGKITYKAYSEVTEYNRKHEYIRDILIGRDSSLERNLYRYSESVNDLWNDQFEKSRKLQLKSFINYFSKVKIGGIITAIISVIMISLLIYPTINKIISIGLFMAITGNILSLVKIGTVNLTNCFKELTKCNGFLVDLNEFKQLSICENSSNAPSIKPLKFETLEFIDVYFKYPNTERYILKGLSFLIKKGNHYAFVGSNGEGKTTIIKLITGLYDCYEGKILINGVEIKKYKIEDIKTMCSVVFQDFSKYAISIKDNIMLGDINSIDKIDNSKVSEVLVKVNLKEYVDELPDKENTIIGKINISNSELSLGQWQRLAIARTLVNKAPLKILDEPTSALDPISESETYKEYQEISSDFTTIFISHRLGATKYANNIFLLNNGVVEESGTHQELMIKNGIYAQMFNNQRSWYL